MRTLLIPIGPPGSGKSTLCNGLQQFMSAINRPCSAVNLDPANDNIPYDAAFDVRELVSVEEVMEREELGPNGGVLWAMEEVEANFDWLEERLEACGMSFSRVRMRPKVCVLIVSRRDNSAGPSRPARAHNTPYGATANTAATGKTRLSCTHVSLRVRVAPLTDFPVDCCGPTSRLCRSYPTKSVLK